jgi:hypothetical protein
MREVEKELNNPETRLNKSRTEELTKQYEGLESDHKSVMSGVLPPRLMHIANQPVGGPVSPDRVLDNEAQPEIRIPTGQQNRVPEPLTNQPIVTNTVPKPPVIVPTAVNPSSSKTSSLLSGITGTVPTPPVINN